MKDQIEGKEAKEIESTENFIHIYHLKKGKKMLTEEDYKKFEQYTSFLDIRIFHDKLQRLMEFIGSLAETSREQQILLRAALDTKKALSIANFVKQLGGN